MSRWSSWCISLLIILDLLTRCYAWDSQIRTIMTPKSQLLKMWAKQLLSIRTLKTDWALKAESKARKVFLKKQMMHWNDFKFNYSGHFKIKINHCKKEVYYNFFPKIVSIFLKIHTKFRNPVLILTTKTTKY
jgi:hypothetical protein